MRIFPSHGNLFKNRWKCTRPEKDVKQYRSNHSRKQVIKGISKHERTSNFISGKAMNVTHDE